MTQLALCKVWEAQMSTRGSWNEDPWVGSSKRGCIYNLSPVQKAGTDVVNSLLTFALSVW